MKRNAIFAGLCLLYLNVSGQSSRYLSAMENALKTMDTATALSSWQQSANVFERIANAEKTQWLPYYYAAYANATLGMKEKSNKVKDNYFDKATYLINKADSLSPENSEILTVQAYVMQGQIQVNPMSRGSKYGPESGKLLEKAISLNPENPRPYLLKGIGLYFTPPMFGGGQDKGCPVINESLLKYESYKSPDAILPYWGKENAVYFAGQCANK